MVGAAVDIVGQSGNPRTITGFQVHKAPVLISQGERCELSNEDYERTKEKK
jgi:26S proteasome regulatory subunit N1